MDVRALLALLFTVVVWGIGPVFLRNLSVELGAADHLAIRYVFVSTLFLAGLAWSGGWRIAREDWPRLLIISLIGMVGYNLGSAFGFERVSAGIGSLIIGTQPLLIALLGALIAHERLGPASIAGLIVAFAGTAILVWGDLALAGNGWDFLIGCGLIFECGVAWAIYVVVSKPLIRKYGAFPITALSIIIATVVMLALLARPSTLATLQTMSAWSWLDMAFIVLLSTILASVTWNFGAARMPAAAAGSFLYLIPLFGVAAGALMLGETVTQNMLTGGVLILAGVAIAQFGPMIRSNATLAALAAILFAVTMWGLIPVAMRFLILGTSPEAAMVLRLYPAGLIAVIAVVIVGVRKIEWRDWGRILIAALAGNVGYQILAAYGMQTVPASWTGLLFGLEPVFIALFAVLLAGERLTPWLVGGIAIAMLGTAALMLGAALAPAQGVSLFGLLLVTLSTMGWGIYTVVIRPVSVKYGAFQVACLALGISALPMVFFVPRDFAGTVLLLGLTQWLAIGFVVVFGTFLATSAWNYALGHMESSVAGMFLYVQPVVAALGGILILGETLTWPLVAGGVLIIAGVALAQFGPRLRQTQLEPEPASAMRSA